MFKKKVFKNKMCFWFLYNFVSNRSNCKKNLASSHNVHIENMVLRRIYGTRSDEVTGEWRRLHNEELNDL